VDPSRAHPSLSRAFRALWFAASTAIDACATADEGCLPLCDPALRLLRLERCQRADVVSTSSTAKNAVKEIRRSA